VLLWVERDTGHGAGKPIEVKVRDAADMVGFLARQLGLPLAGAAADIVDTGGD
jgi:hypothetical protein